jgi:hypothetical protein
VTRFRAEEKVEIPMGLGKSTHGMRFRALPLM